MRRPRWFTVRNARLAFLFGFGVYGVVFEMHSPSPNPSLIALFGGCLGFPFVIRSRGEDDDDSDSAQGGDDARELPVHKAPAVDPVLDDPPPA